MNFFQFFFTLFSLDFFSRCDIIDLVPLHLKLSVDQCKLLLTEEKNIHCLPTRMKDTGSKQQNNKTFSTVNF